MTTIATDGKTIAADGQAQSAWGCITSQTTQKIHVRDGAVFAFAGSAAMMEPLMAWYQRGADAEKLPVCDHEQGWSMLVITQNGAALYTSKAPYPDIYEAPWAIGTGCDYALGAMYAGASPEEAVRIARQLDTGTGGIIQVVDIAEALKGHIREAAE